MTDKERGGRRRRSVLYAGLCCIVFLLAGTACSMSVPLETSMQAGSNFSEPSFSLEIHAQKEPVINIFSEMEKFRYDFNRLEEAEKLWYLDMEKAILTMDEDVILSKEGLEKGLDETSIDRIFQCLLNDHPEFFYVDGYTYTTYMIKDKLQAIYFSGSYTGEEDEVRQKVLEVEVAAEPFLENAPVTSDEYETVKYVYEALIKETEYDPGISDNQNISSVFLQHRSVCQGYAKAAQYLLNRLGVECVLVQGTVDTGEGHAWNLVKVNGSYYYMDVTWGDASYRKEETEGKNVGNLPAVNYDYLCVTTEELLRTHILKNPVPLPVCTEDRDNYYVREGSYFTEYDEKKLETLFSEAQLEQKEDVAIKCGDVSCFENFLRELIEEKKIFQYLDCKGKKVGYTHNEKQLSMTFWVTNA